MSSDPQINRLIRRLVIVILIIAGIIAYFASLSSCCAIYQDAKYSIQHWNEPDSSWIPYYTK